MVNDPAFDFYQASTKSPFDGNDHDEYEPSAVQLEFEDDELEALGDPRTQTELSLDELQASHEQRDQGLEAVEHGTVHFDEEELNDFEGKGDWQFESPAQTTDFEAMQTEQPAKPDELLIESKYFEMDNSSPHDQQSDSPPVSQETTNNYRIGTVSAPLFTCESAVSTPVPPSFPNRSHFRFEGSAESVKTVRFNQYETPRNVVSAMASSTANRMIGTPGSTSDVLVEARNECIQLRSLNERLAQSLEEAQRFAGDLRIEKERIVMELRRDHENTLKRQEERDREKYESMEKMYKSQLNQLIVDLKNAEKGHEKFQELRVAQEREKEIEILTLRKELLVEKEKQLEKLISDFGIEKAAMIEKFESEKKEMAQTIRKSFERNVSEVGTQCDDMALEMQEKDSRIEELEKQIILLKESSEQSAKEQLEEVARLEDLLASANTLPTPPPPPPALDNLVLEEKLDALKRDLEQDFRVKQESFLKNQNDMVKRLKEDNDRSVKELAKRCEEEKQRALEDLKETHLQEQRKVALQVKDQCSTFYESALKKVKSDFQIERKSMQDQLKVLAERSTLSDDSNNNITNHYKMQAQMSLREIESLRSRLESLQANWSEEKTTYSTLLNETKRTLEEDKRVTLHRMKMQYLETLRKIRDEIRQSKLKNAESMEIEWNRRKQELIGRMEADHDLKILRLKTKYENHMQELLEMSKTTKRSLSAIPQFQ